MEEWKDIVGYESIYQVSNLGKVKSLSRLVGNKNGYSTKKECILSTAIQNGYLEVRLSKNGTSKHKCIHRLIAEAFIPNLNNFPVVRHLNDNRLDNRLDNLAWGTYGDNMADSIKNGTYVNSNAILTIEQVKEIKILLAEGLSCWEISRKFPVGNKAISKIKREKSWKNI